jgi:WD40 repeat protein
MKLQSLRQIKLPAGVLGLAVTPDAKIAYAACADGALYAVDLARGTSKAFATTHASFASGCVLLPEGGTLISAGYDGTLLWHDTATLRSWRRVPAHRFWSWSLGLSPDGSRVASTTGQFLAGGWRYEPAPESEPSVKVFDTRTGDLVAAFSHVPSVQSCAFSPDGHHLAAANILGEVRVWDLRNAAGVDPVSIFTSPDFTSWGSIKTHHPCGGIFGMCFSPDGCALVVCGMGPMNDPMAGNGKMTWQRWDWQRGVKLDQIKDGQHGNGLMESIAWMPDGSHFLMAGRQAQGTWNAALFSAGDGALVHSVDTKNRITRVRVSADGKTVVMGGAVSQPPRKNGVWPEWGKIECFSCG